MFDANVRQWEVAEADDKQRITVQLFEPARSSQSITIELEKFSEEKDKLEVQVEDLLKELEPDPVFVASAMRMFETAWNALGERVEDQRKDYASQINDAQGQIDKLINRLIANAPLPLRAIKSLLVREMAFRDGIAHDDVDALILAARTSQDAMEGMTARMEKRPANFRGQ